MKAKTRKILAYTSAVMILGSLGFYVSMKDYQKQNMAELFNQTFS
ncbi:hypothetical protein MTsDn1_15040 [Alteromonas sp. MTD1]